MKLSSYYIVLLVFLAIPTLAIADTLNISRVVIEGNQRLEVGSVLSVISVKAGAKVTTDDIDADNDTAATTTQINKGGQMLLPF